MDYVYELLSEEHLKKLPEENKKIFFSDVILSGKLKNYQKFLSIFDDDITTFFTSDDIKKLLPMNIDYELLEILLTTFKFPNSEVFFYNYSVFQPNPENKQLIYDFYVDNYSDVMVDNLKFYENMLTPQKFNTL